LIFPRAFPTHLPYNSRPTTTGSNQKCQIVLPINLAP